MEYYNLNKLLSFDRIFNMIVGARGLGKTYAVKKFVIRQFLRGKGQFVYVRRYKAELEKVPFFFKDVASDPEFANVHFEVKGRSFYINKKLAGYAIPLSAWQKEKSNSYPDVTTVMFDEFIREKDMGRYLPNEVNSFLNLFHTIIRNRDDARAIFMSNAVSIVNPYFLYFKLVPEKDKSILKKESIVLEIIDGEKYKAERENTRFGKLIEGTDYAEMAVNNKFTLDVYTFTEKRSKDSTFVFNIKYKGKHYGVWVDLSTTTMYFSRAFDPSSKNTYVMMMEDMDEGLKFAVNAKSHYHLIKFKSAFTKGLLRFDDIELRNVGYEILNKL